VLEKRKSIQEFLKGLENQFGLAHPIPQFYRKIVEENKLIEN
jgi:hypothetical protein